MDKFDLRKYLAENKLLKENEEYYEEIISHMNDIWRTDGDAYASKEDLIFDMKENPEHYDVNLNLMEDDPEFDSYLEKWIASDEF